MKARRKPITVAATFLLGLLLATQAGAVDLRFEPQDQNIALNADGSLSIWIDEALEIRTIEVTVTFDEAILSGIQGSQGPAFLDLPCFVWEEYTPETNQWYGFAVAIGADCFVVGPGELYTWTFSGIHNGTSNIEALSVVLYDRFGNLIEEEVVLPPTTVIVGDGIVSVGDQPNQLIPTITASPNPFNPRTEIKFWLPEQCQARLSLFDLRGRLIRELLNGTVPGAWTTVPWDGKTEEGLAAPSGVYIYRLDTNREKLSGRMTLAR